MNKLSLKLIIPSVFLATNAFATQTGWTTVSKIEDGWTSEGMLVTPAATVINPAGCSSTDAYAIIDGTNRGYKTKSSMIMGAMLGGKSIRFEINGSSCEASRPKIDAVYIQVP